MLPILLKEKEKVFVKRLIVFCVVGMGLLLSCSVFATKGISGRGFGVYVVGDRSTEVQATVNIDFTKADIPEIYKDIILGKGNSSVSVTKPKGSDQNYKNNGYTAPEQINYETLMQYTLRLPVTITINGDSLQCEAILKMTTSGTIYFPLNNICYDTYYTGSFYWDGQPSNCIFYNGYTILIIPTHSGASIPTEAGEVFFIRIVKNQPKYKFTI